MPGLSQLEAPRRWTRPLLERFPRASIERAPEQGNASVAVAGGVVMMSIASDRHAVAHAGGVLPGRLAVVLQDRGAAACRWSDRSLELGPGEVLVHDASREVRFELSDGYRQRVVLLPGDGAALAGPRVVAPPVARLLACSLAQLPPAGQLVSSLVRLATSPQVRVRWAVETIEVRGLEEGFRADHVARAQGISRRGLDQLFAAAGTTVDAVLWEFRLAMAHARITGSTVPLGEVAARTGFASAAHFSRRFRQRFGVAPSAVPRGRGS